MYMYMYICIYMYMWHVCISGYVTSHNNTYIKLLSWYKFSYNVHVRSFLVLSCFAFLSERLKVHVHIHCTCTYIWLHFIRTCTCTCVHAYMYIFYMYHTVGVGDWTWQTLGQDVRCGPGHPISQMWRMQVVTATTLLGLS